MDRTSVRNLSTAGPPVVHDTAFTTPAPRRAAFPFLLPALDPGELGRLGTYRVLSLLGEGGMGYVFEAADITLGRAVALKVLKPDPDDRRGDGRQRFLREARAMAAIQHDHLATVYQVGEEGNVVYLAMELLRGETLDARLRGPTPLGYADILRIGRELATGLAVVHLRGLIHRDIKPANVWLEAPTGRVKILDFGLARRVVEDARLTRDGAVVGTPSYLSPEQALGHPTDARSDLFSLGCVLYRACCGATPFPAENTVAQLVAVAYDEAVPLRSVNPAVPELLAELIHRLLAKNPDARPASAVVLADELLALERRPTPVAAATTADVFAAFPDVRPAEAGARPRSGGDSYTPRKPRRASWLTVGLVVAGVVVLLAFGIVGAGRMVRKPPEPAPAPPAPPRPTVAAPKANPTGITAGEDRVFLTDLTPTTVVAFEPFLKKGMGGRPGAFPPVSVAGKASPHGLFMHAVPGDDPQPALVVYQLPKGYKTFGGRVGLNDTSMGSHTPMTFAVLGDDRPLWSSRPISEPEDEEPFAVPVAGVAVLKLTVRVPGHHGGAHGVWVEPQLAK